MGVSLGIALEIFSNPYDLYISVYRETCHKVPKYSFRIERQDREKNAVSIWSACISDTRDGAIVAVRDTLREIQWSTEEVLEKTKVKTKLKVKSVESDLDPAKTLNADIINWVTDELFTSQMAETWKMPRPS